MYNRAYGIIETLAPLHVGASAGEETGNLNLIFRDQFTQTGIIPGSSIRGRFRADMRGKRQHWLESQLEAHGVEIPDSLEITEVFADGSEKKFARIEWLQWQFDRLEGDQDNLPKRIDENHWYGHHAIAGQEDGGTTEAIVKFEYASLLWMPVFCPGQPIVWVSSPRLLRRYQQITGISGPVPKPSKENESSKTKYPARLREHRDRIFFNLGYLDNLERVDNLINWVPESYRSYIDNLVVVADKDIGTIHDMALYRQTRTKLGDSIKKVENFFGFEALPEDCLLVFPIAIKEISPKSSQTSPKNQTTATPWQPFTSSTEAELYFGGLESIGCGRCGIQLDGNYFEKESEQ
jgi:CRISPR-associated protein Cmr4